MTAAEIIYAALVWGEEGMEQMISGCAEGEYRDEVSAQLKQLRAYRKRRFPPAPDPFKNAKPMSLDEIRASRTSGE
jgi:acyl-CoA hydrolase